MHQRDGHAQAVVHQREAGVDPAQVHQRAVDHTVARQQDQPAEAAHHHAHEQRREHQHVQQAGPARARACQVEGDRIAQQQADGRHRQAQQQRVAQHAEQVAVGQRTGVVAQRQPGAIGRADGRRPQAHQDDVQVGQQQEHAQQHQRRGDQPDGAAARRRRCRRKGSRSGRGQRGGAHPGMTQAWPGSKARPQCAPSGMRPPGGVCTSSVWPPAASITCSTVLPRK